MIAEVSPAVGCAAVRLCPFGAASIGVLNTRVFTRLAQLAEPTIGHSFARLLMRRMGRL